MRPEPTPKEIRLVAHITIDIFEKYGFSCCLFGSLACHIYGMKHRDPGDVDLVVLNHKNLDTEDLKELLCDDDDNFYLVDSKRAHADYRVLWYKVPARRSGVLPKPCKVDILITGMKKSLNVPWVRQVESYKLPVMPLLPLLYMELSGWHGHRFSPEFRKRRKVRRDIKDIKELLKIATDEWDLHRTNKDQKMAQWYMNDMAKQVRKFIKKVPDTQERWETLGFWC
ncbi:hypothetical protein VKT23_014700 [Stygiomarasmius scandens]|uniref:Uncharacterized protein n=1 Tax=Marasmiellus scandens TaxID=2682957 RepID=A0ABR1J1Y9_9AGAR